MKSTLILACLSVASTSAYASAYQASAHNPKTAQKAYVPDARSTAQDVRSGFGANPARRTDAGAGLRGSPQQKRQQLLQQKLAAQAQPNPSPMTQGTQQGNPLGVPTTLPLNGSDNCATPDVIAGNGAFAFNNTSATTGTQGQGESLCNFYTFTGIDRDVWFRWTAPSTGVATFSLCNGTSMDSKIAVYPGTGCPTAGSALACNDDSCNFQSQTTFPVVAGGNYLLQLGNFPGSAGGSGVFLMQVALPLANDDCNTAQVIAGTGIFSFDTALATTGTDGQNETLCAVQWGQTAIENDVWFTWTAPSSGIALVSTCGLTSVDTEIAAYAGSGCPVPGSALACKDESCWSTQATIQFPVTSGATYTLQIGSSPSTPGGSGHFSVDVLLPPPNDDCNTPLVLNGVGTFPFDNTVASTGTEGQSEALCDNGSGQPAVSNDVWFTWTPPSTGLAQIDTCSLSLVETKLAVYAGSGCPTAGSALVCNEGACQSPTTGIFQATVAFAVTGGTPYTIQLGTGYGGGWYPNDGGSGSMSISLVPLVANDDCSTPIVISGVGTFPFDNTVSTTGTEGQNEALCAWQYGQTTIERDIWFQWTSPVTGRASIKTCGAGNTLNTKLAAYAGSGCPVTGTALACSDDECGLQSTICIPVTAGSVYMIQLGTPCAFGVCSGTGTFDISTTAQPLNPCTWDDGTTENLLTWGLGGDMVWLNRFGSAGSTTLLSSVDIMWGSAMFPGYNPATNGQFATDVLVWQDGPSQDGDPSDATLLQMIPTTVTVWDTDTYVTLPITPLSINGVYFVGCHQDNYGLSGAGPVQYVAPMDTGCTTTGVAWYFGNNSGYGTSPVNYGNPGANVQPPVAFSWGLAAQVCIRAGCSAGAATYLCDPGAGGTLACPCSNPPSGSGRGCNNSAATGGASISGSGSNSLASANLVFTTASEKPTATSILLQGTAVNPAGVAFGQGVRCSAGVLKRLYVKTASGGSITAPAGSDPSIPSRSATLGDPISAGQNRWYTVYYRDPVVLGGCSSTSTFNCTNTALVGWQP